MPRTYRKTKNLFHELKKNIRPRGIIENTDLNQDSTNDPSLDESVDLSDRLDSMEVDDNDQMMIESNQPSSQRETYTFLPKKLPKDNQKENKRISVLGSGGITYPIVVIEQNISDYDDDGDADGDDSESVDDELNFTEENPNESSSSGLMHQKQMIYMMISKYLLLILMKASIGLSYGLSSGW
ncbi:unnamed protein product [Rhizophagus irregularis]|nr:unnamed protein product [Rhizophagus irregularis]